MSSILCQMTNDMGSYPLGALAGAAGRAIGPFGAPVQNLSYSFEPFEPMQYD